MTRGARKRDFRGGSISAFFNSIGRSYAFAIFFRSGSWWRVCRLPPSTAIWRIGPSWGRAALSRPASRVAARHGRFYPSALYPTLQRIDVFLARWADRKFKSLRRHKTRAIHWLQRIARRQTGLFAHWALLFGRGRTMGAVQRAKGIVRISVDVIARATRKW